MGEYVNVQGKDVKLGTCEDLYYARLDQLETAQAVGVEGIDEYLNPDAGFRYRFPFPDEDDHKLGDYDNYDRGIPVTMPYRWVADHVDHATICVGTSVKGAHNVNHSILCPASPEWKQTCSARPGMAVIEIVQQKQIKGTVWTVCRCGWCGVRFRLPPKVAQQLVDRISEEYIDLEKDQSRKTWYTELSRRILAGYIRQPREARRG